MPIRNNETEGEYFGRIRRRRQRPEFDVRLRLIRLPETNEWKVEWIQGGMLDEPKSYYTDDKQDAYDTLRAMENEAIRMGFRVEVIG